MALPDRQSVRERVAALMTANGSWEAIYDYQPKSLGGVTPVGTVHGGPYTAGPSVFRSGEPDATVEVWITNYAKRTGSGGDPATAEDVLDNLAQQIAEIVDANGKDAAGGWDDLSIIGQSEPDYYLIDGEQYRAEVFRISAAFYQ